jgi:uncharacterized protein
MLSALCLRCGLCCDGTLFRHVEIQATERERLEALGLPCADNRKREVMLLPCGKLEGKCCSIYEQRPQGCRAFVCALGRRLVAKELGVAEAEATVDEMLARLDALRAVFPEAGTEPILRYARARISDPTTRVTDDQLAAFKRVEELRYAAFVPPTV